MSEGFYFRHDSIKNPNYEMNLEKNALRKDADKDKARMALLKRDIEAMILEKMKF